MVFDSSNDYVYIAYSGSNNVSFISKDNEDMGNITAGHEPDAIAFDPVNNEIYVANYNSNNVSIITVKENQTVESIDVGKSPDGIAYDSSNGYLYTISYEEVFVINSENNTVINGIRVGNGDKAIAYNP